MSDLLPILFTRGVNQGVDPRVAPPGTLKTAENVRWRKDGRPAKRYGVSNISSVGLDSGGTVYTQHAVNFIGSWRGSPIMGLGAGVRRLIATSTWSDIGEANSSNLPHWAPGRHDPIARSDQAQLGNSSVAYANGFLMYAWDDGSLVYTQVATPAGAILFTASAITNGVRPRVVGVGSKFFLVYQNGTAVRCQVFDTATLTFGSNTTLLTLVSSSGFFDAAPLPGTSDWLLVGQTAATTLTVHVQSNTSTVAFQVIATSASPGNCKMSIAGNSPGAIFVAWLEPATGALRFSAFDQSLNLTGGPTTIDTDTGNVDQPGIVLDLSGSNLQAGIIWGGNHGGSNAGGYLSYADVQSTGSSVVNADVPHVRPCSKPFYGNGGVDALDGRFVWVHTDNGTAWADQRSHYLLWLNRNNPTAKISMWTPGITGSQTGSQRLSDVTNDGTAASNTAYWTTFNQSVRSSPGITDGIGVDSVSFSSIYARQREAARDTQVAGRALQISGGILTEFNGQTEESGFMLAPVVFSVIATAGGLLTASSTYLYVVVFEWIDAQGRRHRSAPSDPVSLATTASNQTGQLQISCLPAFSRAGSPTMHVYRTLAGGTTYHRVTPNTGAPSVASGGVAFVTYSDSIADVIAAQNEFIYTDGGVVPNVLPPPSTFIALVGGRLWLGGQLDRNVVTASKLLIEGEPSQFSDEAEFSVFLPDECTGLAGLDGTLVAFGRESIYLVNGDGPNNQGVGAFSSPQKLPTDVGCIDWRSVVETSIGILFQSKRGIFLLPRGLNTPVFVGQEVESSVALFPICKSSTLVSIPTSQTLGETTARFMMADSEAGTSTVCLTYDLRAQGWSVDSTPDNVTLGVGGSWNDTFVFSKGAGSFASLWFETSLGYSDHGNFISTSLGTGDVRPFGVCGYGEFKRVCVIGEYRDNSQVTVSVSVDSGTPDTFLFPVTSADGADGAVYLDVTPQLAKGCSISVSVSDSAIGGAASEGFIAQAIMIETDLIGRTERLAQGRRA